MSEIGLGKTIKKSIKILKKGGASVLVLTCIDPRFTDILSSFLYQQVWADYDLFALAGASLGVVQGYDSNINPLQEAGGASWPANSSTPNDNPGETNGDRPGFPSFMEHAQNWTDVFIEHLGLAKALHNISEVWVFDHLDCGAYKAFMLPPETEDNLPGPHILNLTTFKDQLAYWSQSLGIATPKFKGFLMRQNGSITLEVADPGGIDIGETNGYVDVNAWTQNDWYAFLLYLFIIFGIIYVFYAYSNGSLQKVRKV
jgi:hypothetical protein